MKKNIFKILLLIFFTFALSINNAFSEVNWIDSLINSLEGRPEDSTKVEKMVNIAKQIRLSDPEKAVKLCDSAIYISKKIKNQICLAKSYNAKGLSLFTRSEYAKSIDYLLRALKINEHLNNRLEMAFNLGNLGLVYADMKDNQKALEFDLKALEIFKELNASPQLATEYCNIGIAYVQMENLDKAQQYYNEQYKIDSLLNNKQGLLRYYSNMGTLFISRARKQSGLPNKSTSQEHQCISLYYKSIENSMIALKLSREINDKHSEGLISLNIGSAYSEIFFNTYTQGYKLTKEQDQLYKMSVDYFLQAIKLAKEIHFLTLQSEANKSISEIYALVGNYKDAYNHLLLFYAIKDSINNNEFKKQIVNLEMTRENELKQKEIVILTQKNKIQQIQLLGVSGLTLLVVILTFVLYQQNQTKKQHNKILEVKNTLIEQKNNELEILLKDISDKKIQIEEANIKLEGLNEDLKERNSIITENNAQLRELNGMKDKLFSIIAHDLRNPMQSLITNSEILIYNFHTLNEEVKLNKNKQILESSKQLINLLENLIAWAYSQTGRVQFNPMKFNLNNSMSVIEKLLEPQLQNKQIILNSSIPENYEIYADINMISTVLRNIVSNAIKFSNKFSTIEVNATDFDDEYYQISVIDKGVGIKAEDQALLFSYHQFHSTRGTNNEKGTGLGLLICKEFIEKNKGKIWLESEIGVGTKVHFTVLKMKDYYSDNS
jgi:signal transduction histidine kinase